MDNPNEYNDEKYLEASNALHSAVSSCWGAGASRETIETDFEDAIEEAAA